MALPAFPAGSTFWDVDGVWVVVFKLASGEAVARRSTPVHRKAAGSQSRRSITTQPCRSPKRSFAPTSSD